MFRILPGIHSLEQHLEHLQSEPEAYRPEYCPHCGKAGVWRHGHYARKAPAGEGLAYTLGGLEQVERTAQIDVEVELGVIDRRTDTSHGGEMNDAVESIRGKQRLEPGLVPYIRLAEHELLGVRCRAQNFFQVRTLTSRIVVIVRT